MRLRSIGSLLVLFFLDAPDAAVALAVDVDGSTFVTAFIKFVTFLSGRLVALFDGLARSKPSCLFKILHCVKGSNENGIIIRPANKTTAQTAQTN